MNSFSTLRLPLIGGAALLLLLAGCAHERVGAPELSEGGRNGMKSAEVRSTDEQVAEGRVPDAALKLGVNEEKAFSRTEVLDAGMNAAETRQVKYHFIKYVRERRSTLEKFLRNGIPYVNHSRAVFRSRGMPEELAYLAYLESGYNPLAVSSSKAVGMWQFMAPTGRDYGLRQDWWVDERMDPVKSTEAAAKYLARLYSIFHDWHLAIASYNGGEGKIGRAKSATGAGSLHEIIRRNGSLSYDMQLREETRLYVPRFLAIAKIMRDPEKLGIRPAAPDPSHPVLVPSVALTAKPATDLVELARRLGMTWKEFLCYNPQFLRSISPAGRESTVYIPRTREQQARSLRESALAGAGWTYSTVRRKDTLARVSAATGVPASVLSELNPGALTEGRRLRVPARAGSAAPSKSLTSVSAAVSDNPYDHASAALAELEQLSVPSVETARAGKASKG
ncbi:MAG: transglycosylase SLT domain-containing protein, partial [Mailhella sp.]|nr:transglycosylase SLT domain-containing protein [Mailhella sp.]